LSINPTFIPARKNLGVVLWFANRKAEAEKIFRSLLPEIPKDPVPHLYLGLALYERRQFAGAKRHFVQAGDLAMKNPEVLPMVVDSFLSVKDETIVPHALQFNDNTNLASVFDRHGKAEHAFAILSKAIASNPDQEQGYTILAAFASAHQNDAYALKTVEQGLARIPGSAVLLLQKGLLLAFGGDREKARESFRAASEANPKWSLPLLSMGILELEAGHAEAAVEVFQKAITIAPNEAQGYYFSALAQSRVNESGAIETLRKALAIDPKHARSSVLLGQLQISTGKLQEGVAELERALRSDPTNRSALYQIALAYRKLGRIALSKKYMAEFRAQKDEQDQTALVQIMRTMK
jgi:tetratricopeptide (TPR) repeat protein